MTCGLEKEQETKLEPNLKQNFVLQHAKQSAGCMGRNTGCQFL